MMSDVKERVDGLEALCDDWDAAHRFTGALVAGFLGSADADAVPAKLASYEDITEAHGAHFMLKCRAAYDDESAPRPKRTEVAFPELRPPDERPKSKIDACVLKAVMPRDGEEVRLAGVLYRWAKDRAVVVKVRASSSHACVHILSGVSIHPSIHPSIVRHTGRSHVPPTPRGTRETLSQAPQ
jgi:hypothetical protein